MHATNCTTLKPSCLRMGTVRLAGRLLMLGGLLLVSGLVTQSDAVTYDNQRDAFLEAVAIVETNGNPRAVGSLGERGLYQFTRTTWKQHTKRSHYEAHDPNYSTVIARKHYDWLYQHLSNRGFPPSPYWLAVAWNSGLKRTTSGRFPSVSRQYAERVTNLVFDSERQLLVMNRVPRR